MSNLIQKSLMHKSGELIAEHFDDLQTSGTETSLELNFAVLKFRQRYLSLMKEADIIIGNSSSGLIEAPAVKKATVNIGDRQKGRLKATSGIDSAEPWCVVSSTFQTIQHRP